jgi:lipopolysaccharide heptosyltransferase I
MIRPSALGDVCRSVPVLVSLRRAYPSTAIDWVVQDTFVDAVQSHPELRDVIAFPRRLFSKQVSRGTLGPALRWLGALARREYDLVVDCQGLLRSGIMSRATRARRRIADRNAREMSWLAATERYRIDPTLHTVDRMLSLIEHAGIEPVRDMTLHTPHDDRERIASDPQLAGKRFAVIAPTSRWDAKRWPIDRFAQVAHAVSATLDAVVIVGSPSEREQCQVLTAMARTNIAIIDRVGATSVGSLMAIIEAAQIVIANDSAALHMAVGFGRPIVALYGPTRVDLVGPYQREADVIQHTLPGDRFEHKEDTLRTMMERIEVGEVLEAIDDRLS